MNCSSQTIPSPGQVVRLLATHKRHWLIPAVVVGVLALLYALFRPATWEASQALIVRDEATNNEVRPGEFGHADEMKTLQETILELAKSGGVLSAALGEIGPPAGERPGDATWPSPADVARLRDRVKLTPPKGAEFGKTEVFYLKVRDHDRDRAVALNRATCGHLQARLQELRDAKAQSMISELAKTVHLAKNDLQESTARLEQLEKQVGSDLAELRVLNEPGLGDSALRRTMTEIRSELRQIDATRRANQELLALLVAAGDDPGRLLATPNRLLESQPALRRLKDGLVDAQLATAALMGTMSAEHPLVKSALQSEEEIGRHLHDELSIAIRGLNVELQMNDDRATVLEGQLAEVTARLGRLAELRASYANQLAETANRTQRIKRAEQNLSEAQATHASAKATNLISRIDVPDTGVDPVGPSRSLIVLLGIAGGLAVGFGVVVLVTPPVSVAGAHASPAEPTRPSPVAAGPFDLPAPVVQPRRRPVACGFPADQGLSIKQALQKVVLHNTV
ncbi:MAG: hypothetical protein JXB62_03515 [Pirellulales bacterium]|nr:hypothetical protein [Pirellulales bacterium]